MVAQPRSKGSLSTSPRFFEPAIGIHFLGFVSRFHRMHPFNSSELMYYRLQLQPNRQWPMPWDPTDVPSVSRRTSDANTYSVIAVRTRLNGHTAASCAVLPSSAPTC